MQRAYAKRPGSYKPEPALSPDPSVASGREIQLPLDREELLGLMQGSLEALALELGMLVASSLLEDEVTRLCGRRAGTGKGVPSAGLRGDSLILMSPRTCQQLGWLASGTIPDVAPRHTPDSGPA